MRFASGYPIIVVLGGVMLWEIIARSGYLPAVLFPSFGEVLNHVRIILTHWDMGWMHVIATVYRMVVGFLIALSMAIVIGLLIGSNSVLYRASKPAIGFFRSLPGTAMFPVFLLFLGIGDMAKITIVAFIAFRIILHTTIDGVLYASRTRKQVAKLFGASGTSLFIVSWYDSLPYVIVGSKSALSVAFWVSIVSEMFIGSVDGIGQQIFDSYNLYNSATMFAWIVIAGVVGSCIAGCASLVERQLLFWKPKQHEQ